MKLHTKIHNYLQIIMILSGLFAIFSIYVLENDYLISIGILGFFGFMIFDILYMISDIIWSIYKNAKTNKE